MKRRSFLVGTGAAAATAVIGSPIVLTAISLYAAYLYFRDDSVDRK
jgi:hypothetical protein